MIPQVELNDYTTHNLPNTFALVLGVEHTRSRWGLPQELEEADKSVEGMEIVPYFIGDEFVIDANGRRTDKVRSRYFFFSEKEAFAFVMANGGQLSTHPWPPGYETDMAKLEGFLEVVYTKINLDEA